MKDLLKKVKQKKYCETNLKYIRIIAVLALLLNFILPKEIISTRY